VLAESSRSIPTPRGLKKEPMSSLFYSAAWTECGCFLGCSHEHKTTGEANSCIPCAGGYVVAVEDGVMRSLTAEEESEFQRVHYAARIETPVVQEEAADDPRYAVMIRIRVGDRWIWTTWMLYAMYAEAAAHAREGNKVVRFRSAEYVALRKQTEAASPLVIKAPRESIPPQCEGETFVEFVNRFLKAYSFDQPAEPHSDKKHGSVDPAGIIPIGTREDGSLTSESDEHTSIIETPSYFAHLILSRLSQSEMEKLRGMRNEDIAALLKVLAIRFLRSKSRCQ
jgi:hypothetical protein